MLHGNGVQPQHRDVANRLAERLPQNEKPLAPDSAHRILEKRADGFYWLRQKIDPAARVD